MDALAPGAYTISARAPGLREAELRTQIVAGQTTRVSGRLGAPAASAHLEITVRGTSEAERRREAAEAVTVVETQREQRQSADLGEVLARTPGVGVRRSGGLGSSTRFSLNGFSDDQVRFFVDGLPLDLAGYPFGVANVPVSLVERIEIYSGVVPVRFGADALGGAVHLLTDRRHRGSRATASYEVGSFDTHRLTLGVRRLSEQSGLFTRVNGFLDYAENDYPMTVEVPDERGRLSAARVRRFHDSYRAAGVNAEVGFVDRPWARRLLVRAFATDYDKDYQHDLVMSVPYGAATYGATSAGASVHYERLLGRGVAIEALTGYAHTRDTFRDVSRCAYDWFGRCARQRLQAGETSSRPHDQVYWDHSVFARLNLGWQMHRLQQLRLTVAPTYLTRAGDERAPGDPRARDPLAAERELWTLVSGLEYELDLFGGQLENILFFKQYVQRLDSEEARIGGGFRRRDRATLRHGVGDGLRVRFMRGLYAKVNYEYATRLPTPDEVFGDNVLVAPSLELQPETSHNANAGIALTRSETPFGAVRGSINAFIRDADRLIVLLGDARVERYQNVHAARSVGMESAIGWTSPGEHLWLDGTLTYQDVRTTSSSGTFGGFEGDRLPNRPYLFASTSARLQFRDVVTPRDEVALTWSSRYVHQYFRGWESVGQPDSKQVIPAQLVHGLALGYLVQNDRSRMSTSLEAQNLTDEPVFDFVGAQRPGRAFYAKLSADF